MEQTKKKVEKETRVISFPGNKTGIYFVILLTVLMTVFFESKRGLLINEIKRNKKEYSIYHEKEIERNQSEIEGFLMPEMEI